MATKERVHEDQALRSEACAAPKVRDGCARSDQPAVNGGRGVVRRGRHVLICLLALVTLQQDSTLSKPVRQACLPDLATAAGSPPALRKF